MAVKGDIFDQLAAKASEKPEGDVFDKLAADQPSRARSLASAYPKGVLKGSQGLTPFMPRGPIPPEVANRVFDQVLKTQPKGAENFLERAGTLTPIAAQGPEGFGLKAAQLGLGTIAGEIAKENGLGETGQTVSELGAMSIPGLTKAGVNKLINIIKKHAPNIWNKIKKNPKDIEKILIGEGVPISSYEAAENALQDVRNNNFQESFGGGVFSPSPPGSGPSLTGRASSTQIQSPLGTSQVPPAIEQGNPLGGRVSPNGTPIIRGPKSDIDFPNMAPSEGASLEGRVTQSSNQLRATPREVELSLEESGRIVSPNKFKNEATGGRVSQQMVQNAATEERKGVSQAYKEAEQVYSGQEDIFPELSKKVDDVIERYSQSAEPNAGEIAVLKYARSLQKMLGGEMGYINVPINRLIRTSDSMTGVANFEMPFTGPKEALKKLSQEINTAVQESLKARGVDPVAMKIADQKYSQWANKFGNDEIISYLKREHLNPEHLYRQAIKDEGTYRALKQAIGNTPHGRAALDKIAREIVEDRLRPFIKDNSKVGSPEYNKVIKNLEDLIGKERVDLINERLEMQRARRSLNTKQQTPIDRNRITGATQKREITPKVSPEVKERLRERNQALGSRVTGATSEKPFPSSLSKTQQDKVAKTFREKGEKPKEIDNQFTRKIKKIAEYTGKDPEYILDKLNSRTGIKQLRRDLKPEHFDTLTRQKMRSVLREGNIESSFNGDSLYQVLNKEKNYEIFSEIIGEIATESARKAAKIIGKRQMTQGAIKDLITKKLIISYLGRDVIKFLKVLEKVV